MITGLMITLTGEARLSDTPTLMLFSTAPEADAALFKRFEMVAKGKAAGNQARLTWGLPDPALTLGTVTLSAPEAADYRARNAVSGQLQLLLASDRPGSSEKVTLALPGLYADWSGALSATPPPDASALPAPVSGLGGRRARYFRERGQTKPAVAALLAEFDLCRFDEKLRRRAGYALHEAALLAESLGREEAWEYFETVALMTYPNCHDALIGLALRAQDAPEQMQGLFSRAYAIRPKKDDAKLYARAIAGAGGGPPTAARDALLAAAEAVNLDAPVFVNTDGSPLTMPTVEIRAHLAALGEG